MNGTIDIVPEVVGEEVNTLSAEIAKFEDLCEQYMLTNKKLESWKSTNKLILEQKIEDSKPAFKEAVDVITSYKDVAGKSVALINDAERQIRERLMA